jgi:hypothetical protein
MPPDPPSTFGFTSSSTCAPPLRMLKSAPVWCPDFARFLASQCSISMGSLYTRYLLFNQIILHADFRCRQLRTGRGREEWMFCWLVWPHNLYSHRPRWLSATVTKTHVTNKPLHIGWNNYKTTHYQQYISLHIVHKLLSGTITEPHNMHCKKSLIVQM